MKQKILILGATGMVGHKLFFEFSKKPDLDVWATIRKTLDKKTFSAILAAKIIAPVDALKFDTVERTLEKLEPDVLINCIGITKKLINEKEPLETIEINSLFPHWLARACSKLRIRMIQMATDCVFSGAKGNYKESDIADATDLYGRTKYLGELNYPNTLTIRTSFIGHEFKPPHHGLLEWFLSQKNQVRGYRRAIYSGVSTLEIARIFYEYILPNKKLQGLYQVSSSPISKYELLGMIAKVYGKKVEIVADGSVKINRSLSSKKFRRATGFRPKTWLRMVKEMHNDAA